MLLRIITVLSCVMLPSLAEAFSQCATVPVAGPYAVIAEEGMNPVTSGSDVYVGYTQKGQVGIATSSDGGKTLGAAKIIFSSKNTTGGLRLGVVGKTAYALFGWVTSTQTELMFASSYNRGQKWTPAADLGPFQKSTLPQLSEDGANVHAAFVTQDGFIAIRNSTDTGRSFSPSVRIAPGAAEVVVSSQGKNVYVAWNTAKPRSDVMFAYSHDGGVTFTTTNLSATRPSNSNEPIIALDANSGRLSMVWREDIPMQGVYLQSLDNGVTWSAPLILDQPTRQYMVADDGTYIYVSYLKKFIVDGTTDWQIYLTRSIDGGHSFPPAKNLSGPTGVSALVNDNQRPVPWASQSDGTFRLSAVEADGVHIWSGNTGHILGSVYLGPGEKAAPSHNSVVWQAPNGTAMHAVCK